jgi:hypothetical protein
MVLGFYIQGASLLAASETNDAQVPNVVEDTRFKYNLMKNDTIVITGYSDYKRPAKVTVPGKIDGYPVVEIRSYAFRNNTHIKQVVLPSSITSIEARSFAGCTSLQSINIPKNMKTIEAGIFDGCKNLREINIPNKVTIIKNRAFNGCVRLKKVKLGKKIKTISAYAFRDCMRLTSIKLPSS